MRRLAVGGHIINNFYYTDARFGTESEETTENDGYGGSEGMS